MFQAFNDMKKSREHAQLVANWMIDKMGEYCVRCGSKEVETVRSYTTGCKKEVLTCGYVKDICSVLEKCYDSMHAAIWEIKGRSMETAFQEPVQQYVRDHYKKKIMLEDIARQCGYSKYHFIRQFKKYFHTGLSEYVNLFRIEKSKELLAQGTYTIERVAEEAGFSSANYFEIVFRKYEGITPSEYRKRQTLGMEQ